MCLILLKHILVTLYTICLVLSRPSISVTAGTGADVCHINTDIFDSPVYVDVFLFYCHIYTHRGERAKRPKGFSLGAS